MRKEALRIFHVGRLSLFADIHPDDEIVQDDLPEMYFPASVQAAGLDWERESVWENST